MRKPVAPVAIILFAAALGLVGCGQEAPAPTQSPDAANLVADEQSTAPMNDTGDNLTYGNVMNSTSVNTNGDHPGPRGQSGSQQDQSRPKNKTADQ